MNSIYHRRSIRKYKDQPVEDEKINAILKAAMAAPSTANQQPWEFAVVKNREVIAKLAEASPHAGCGARADTVIVVSYRTENLPCPDWAQIDCAIAMENMWLACDEEGLGGVWLGIAPVEERMAAVDEIIANHADVRAFGLFALGYPDEEKSPQDHFDEKRIRRI